MHKIYHRKAGGYRLGRRNPNRYTPPNGGYYG
jgi:hypothetical protein